MKCYGSWNIEGKETIGKCCINEKKSINLTVDDINRIFNVISRIDGKTDKGNIILLKSYLTDIHPQKSKYFCEYAILEEKIHEEEINIDSKFNYIKYKLNNLEKWLNIAKFENWNYAENESNYNDDMFEIKNIIKLRNIEKIYLINNNEIKIYIEYEKHIDRYLVEKDGNLNSFYYEPYIHIEYRNPKTLYEIDQDILMINRFFSLFIGFADEIQYYYVGNNNFNFKVYSRFIFACNVEDKRGFEQKYFTEYEVIKSEISNLFGNWYKLYQDKEYKLIFDFYFSSNSTIIEDKYLLVCKALESMYNKENIIKEEQINNEEKINEIKNILFDGNDNNTEEKMKAFISNNNLAKSNKNIKGFVKEIPRVIIEYLYNKYLNKTSFGTKIQSYDEFQIYKDKFEKNDVYTGEYENIYDYAGKTRNYFTHLSEIENTYKENKLIKYIMIIDLIFLNKLLDRIGLDEKKRKKIILDDESYMMINIKSFSTSSNETLQ